MKLLVVSATYVVAINQYKWLEMRRQCPGMVVRILTPRRVMHTFGSYEREITPELGREAFFDIRDFSVGRRMGYLFDPIRFIRILMEFAPDRIHIEEDPYSAVGVETVFLARLVCPKAKISFFIWDNLARNPPFLLNLVKWGLNRYSLSRADLVVCGNQEGETLLREKKGYQGRSAVLPQLGIDERDYLGPRNEELRQSLGASPGVPLIGYVGRLVPEKGVFFLLEALDRLKELPWRAIFLGSGPLAEEIAREWLPRFGDRLILRGAVAHAEVPAYMRALDVLVLPSYATSRWKEQFGLVLAQAMLTGVPCVGSSSGAIPEVIGPGGLVFEEKNVDDLTNALERLIRNEELRRSLGGAGRAFALERYTNNAVAKRYLAEFRWSEGTRSRLSPVDANN